MRDRRDYVVKIDPQSLLRMIGNFCSYANGTYTSDVYAERVACPRVFMLDGMVHPGKHNGEHRERRGKCVLTKGKWEMRRDCEGKCNRNRTQ